jgi:putative ABC transport system permease protein
MITGRWLQPGDHNAIVLNELFLSRFPDMKVGDTIRLQVNGKETDWKVVGFFRFAGKVTGFLAYTDYAYLTEVIGQVQQALLYRIVMADPNPTPEKQDGLAQVIEATMRQDGIQVTESSPGSSLIDRELGCLGILTSFLLFLAGLIALVGSIGIGRDDEHECVERTRDRNPALIGATNRVLMKMVIIEDADRPDQLGTGLVFIISHW